VTIAVAISWAAVSYQLIAMSEFGTNGSVDSEKKGEPDELPSTSRGRSSKRSRRGDASRRTLDLPRREAARAHLYFDNLATRVQHAGDLEVRLPGATCGVIGVRSVIAERNALLA
jgi:hypothetical protein